MTFSPNIVLGNDLLTPYWASNIFPGELKKHRAQWDAAAKEGNPGPRHRLGTLATLYFRLREGAAAGDKHTFAKLCEAVTHTLGHTAAAGPVVLTRDTTRFAVPVLAGNLDGRSDQTTIVIAAEAFTTDPTVLIDGIDGKLASRAHAVDDPAKTIPGTGTAAGLAAEVFAADNHPRFIVVVGGGAVAVIDYRSWNDGKWLGADLDSILGDNDSTVGGELDQFAALFTTVGLHGLIDEAVDGSRKQAVGVSESLRDAVRAGVEAIANEVIRDRTERRKLSVFGEAGGVTINEADLARQAIRWMYRLVVLLYAEARPFIGIVPTDHPLYEAGYGMERLRTLALVELTTEAARNGSHFHQSLNLLFDAVNNGHNPADEGTFKTDADGNPIDSSIGLRFVPLNSRLFGPVSCPDIDKAQLRDHVLQQVILGLCYTPGVKGKGRQTVSYANLELNQLGAVYEGLMAYTGFVALEDRYEVAARKKGEKKSAEGIGRSADPSRGSWTIPTVDADKFPEDVFVTTTDPHTGEPSRVLHKKGTFVFRLAGRDRARSASFYTPSVLTEFTVRHALDEWLANHPDATAADILGMTILEPALGSGAFANETVDQLAELYLRLREKELDRTVPPEDRPVETRKLRAHFAINQTYGVDLNSTAVELAEVALWLNAMHPGLAAPSLAHRLRRGNSLIGATRATYSGSETARQPWKKTGDIGPTPPIPKPPSETPYGTHGIGIHQFLLPGEGWGAAAKTGKSNPVRELASEWAERVWVWRSGIHSKPTDAQIKRAKALANHVETLWATAAHDVALHLAAQNKIITVWGHPNEAPALPFGSSQRFLAPNGPYQRLRTIMDAWCALWMWAPTNTAALPTLDAWLDMVEYLVGPVDPGDTGQLVTSAANDESVELFGKGTVSRARQHWPWLNDCAAISKRQGFFHWELDYAPVLASGGFSVQVGNPPWVRLDWNESSSLAEHDPWWGITKLTEVPEAKKRARRASTLERPSAVQALLSEAAENLGLAALLGAVTREPLLEGLRTNLYMNFITGAFRRIAPGGTVGLLHPETFFSDPSAGPLRGAVYLRLRRHWQFRNKLMLFKDITDWQEFGICVYDGQRLSAEFRQAVNLFHPSTLDGSLDHNGDGELPGIKHPDGDWDLRPHRDRIVTVDRAILDQWVRLFDPPGTPAIQSRGLRPHTIPDLDVLAVFAEQPVRLGGTPHHWTVGLNEKEQKDDGTIQWDTHLPSEWDKTILQGPHILNASPFMQIPNEQVRSNNDWSLVDYEDLAGDRPPRCNYRLLRALDSPMGRFPFWDGKPNTHFVREAHREFIGSGTARTLQACLLPPGPAVVGSLVTISHQSVQFTVRLAGLFSSLPYDYIVKVTGVNHVKEYVTDGLPLPANVLDLDRALMLRTLRLNCVVPTFGSIWESLFDASWTLDGFVVAPGTVDLGAVSTDWNPDLPLRRDLDRWLASCEIDAIVALLLGVSEDQLGQIYRSQFATLRQYEHSMTFDGNGRQVCKISHAFTARQQAFEDTLAGQPKKRGQKVLKLWERVETFRDGDTGVDLAYLVPPFRRADRELAMRTAYRVFAERSGKKDGMSDVPLWEWEVWSE